MRKLFATENEWGKILIAFPPPLQLAVVFFNQRGVRVGGGW